MKKISTVQNKIESKFRQQVQNDKIVKYLDADLMRGLHVYKGKNYSNDISIKHLLKKTSGLNDVFFPLLKIK